MTFFSVNSNFEAPLHAQAETDEQEVLNPQTEQPPTLQETELPKFKEDREQLLQVLAKEVAPNLPAKDVERLQRSVQRRGSYRADWAQSSDVFLVANAPVAELIIYKFSLYKNSRLNDRLLDTLTQFENLRFPRASLAFAEVLGTDASSKIKVLKIIGKALHQDPTLGPDALALLTSSWGSSIPLEERLALASKSCAAWKKSSPQAQEVFARWNAEAESFWAKSFAVEIASCMKGL